LGPDLGDAGARLAALATGGVPAPVQMSDEIDLRASLCDANVKVRNGLMDIQRAPGERLAALARSEQLGPGGPNRLLLAFCGETKEIVQAWLRHRQRLR
jgi:hypothetical protein